MNSPAATHPIPDVGDPLSDSTLAARRMLQSQQTASDDARALINKEECVLVLQHLVRQQAGLLYDIGKTLLQLRELAPDGEFLIILNDRLNGVISQRVAYKYMTFARFCGEHKGLREWGENNFTKALTLYQEVDEGELGQIEDGTHPTLTLDNLSTMSNVKLRQEIRRMRDQVETVAEAERKAHRDTITRLEEENIALKTELESARSEQTPEAVFFEKLAGQIHDASITIRRAVMTLDKQKGSPNMTPEIRARIEGALAAAQRLVFEGYQRFNALFPLED